MSFQSTQPTSDPASAQGAQIALDSFNIPNFPSSARSLKALTLTSDIPVSDYQSILEKPFDVPDSLPFGIESLTLELFSLGYPVGFLPKLAERLPNLKSVVVYSQLFSGLTEESQADAVEFFKRLPNLRALHFLDVFAKENFFKHASKWLKYNTSDVPGEARRGLMFLEVNYTFQHDDDEFVQRIQASELPLLLGPGLISASFNLSTPEPGEGGAETKEGIMTFNPQFASGLVKELTEVESYPRGVRALNLVMYTLTLSDLKKVTEKHSRVMVLNTTVEVEPGEQSKKQLLDALEQCVDAEQIEIVAHPSLQFLMAMQDPSSEVLAKTFPTSSEMDALSQKCPKLKSFKANILRTTSLGSVAWDKNGDRWSGGVAKGIALSAPPS